MRATRKLALAVAVFGGILLTATATSAGTSKDSLQSNTAVAGKPQVAQTAASQAAKLPVGTIRLRVIPRIGAAALKDTISWKVETYGRDSNGNRHTVAEVTGASPELVLPAGWYVVYATLPDAVMIKHPVEVTAGRIFKYTLVKN